MPNNRNVAILREQFEELFPGKWLIDSRTQKNIATGLAGIDYTIQGLTRRRISEWAGPISSGKTSILRSIIAQWCASGMHVVFIDTFDRLQASDWAFVENGNCGAVTTNSIPQAVQGEGKFWVVRNLKSNKGNHDSYWAAEQLIKSNSFDVVIFDLGNDLILSSKISARLHRALERSRTAMIVLRDTENDAPLGTTWGCHSRLDFKWGKKIQTSTGLNGATSIVPDVYANVWKEGISKNIEVNIQTHVSNRLFTHPQIPDRRTPKA